MDKDKERGCERTHLSSRDHPQALPSQTRLHTTGDQMKPPFEVGDLVRLSMRGKMTWSDRSKIRTVGIVTRTNPNVATQRCEVQWASEPEPTEMHWDFIEEVTNKT